MGLETSRVFKCLEKKTLILGFEIIDLFVLSLILCLLNFIFATSDLKLFLTFGPVAGLALGLRALKNGKADNYLLHWLRFYITPGIFRAWPLASESNLFRLATKKGKKTCSIPR